MTAELAGERVDSISNNASKNRKYPKGFPFFIDVIVKISVKNKIC
jgi:hypothetical protein